MLQPEMETPETRGRIWGLWATAGLGLAVFFTYSLIQVLISFIYVRIKLFADPNLDSSVLADNIESDGLLLALATIVSAIAGVALIILFIKRLNGSSVKEYLGLKPLTVRQVFAMIGVYVGVIILTGLVVSIIGDSNDSEFTTDVYNSSVWPVLFGIAVVIFAPAFEETFFRGFLFVGFRQSFLGATGAVVLTAFFWAMIHVQYDWRGMTVIFVLGLVLGTVRAKTGSLWCPVIVHFLWNLFAVIGTALSS